MDDERPNAESIFHHARQLADTSARAAYLDTACAADASLRKRIETMLDADAELGSFLEGPAQGMPETQADDPAARSTEGAAVLTEGPGTNIGPYKLLQQIGEGGFGVVYMAEQEEPVRRRIALKIIKLGMDTKQIIARFEAERQALAVMDHPNIARVLDAGATSTGRPYFVMELVKGIPITDYCKKHDTPFRDRLELLLQVCSAVQHAHQKGIIHRDIKPGNVLVTHVDDKPVPKVIDFGIAKATDQRLTDKTMFTALGQFIGTPAYMSPEQADPIGADIDTRTDVYSLGVLTYELMTGVTPFELKTARSAAIDEIKRIICEEDASLPSVCVMSTAGLAGDAKRVQSADPSALRRQLQGDVDWIVMRAIEKDRSRRYGSPSELAADIERHLRDEPVLAGPPSATYRATKFVRRHRLGVGVAAAALVALVGFAALMAVQTARVTAARHRAERALATSDRVSALMTEMWSGVDTYDLGKALWSNLRERVTTARRQRGETPEQVEAAVALLDRALEDVNATDTALQLLNDEVLALAGTAVDSPLEDDPLIAATLEHTLGETYESLGLDAEAVTHARRAMELRRTGLGPEHSLTLASAHVLARVLDDMGRFEEAEAINGQNFETRRRLLGPDHDDTCASMNNLANVYIGQGRYEEAWELYTAGLEIDRRVRGPEHRMTLVSMYNVASTHDQLGRHEDAAKLHREVFELRRRLLGPEDPLVLLSMTGLAWSYSNLDRDEEAEQLQREVLEIQERTLGRDHPSTLRTINNLGITCREQKRYEEAERLYRQALESQRRVMGRDHPYTLDTLNNLAGLMNATRRPSEAETLHREALEARRRTLGPDHPATLASMNSVAFAAYLQGVEQAAELYREVFERRHRVLGADHKDTDASRSGLAASLARHGRTGEVAKLFRESVEVRRRRHGEDSAQVLEALQNLAVALKHDGQWDESIAMRRECLEISRRVHGSDDARTHRAMNSLAWGLLTREPVAARDPQAALALALEAVEATGFEHPGYMDTLSLAYHLSGETTKAIENQRRALALVPEDQVERRKEFEEALARYVAAVG